MRAAPGVRHFSSPREPRPDFLAIVLVALATRDARRAARRFEATLGWRPIDRPGKIAVPSAWREIAPGQEVQLLEVSGIEPSPASTRPADTIAVSVAKAPFPQLRRRRLEQHGAELIRGDRRTPFDRVFFGDSDGSVFEVVAAERTPETSACQFPLDRA